jgi:hypothetical protein
MSSDRHRLHELVDTIPDTQVQVDISFLAESGDEEIIDSETAAKLDVAREEPGENIPIEEVCRQLGCDAGDAELGPRSRHRLPW